MTTYRQVSSDFGMRFAKSLLVIAVLGTGTAFGTVPHDLSNLHSRAYCPGEILIVRPGSVRDLEQAVGSYGHIQPNGRGCSWNKEMFCAKSTGQSQYDALSTASMSANVQTTTIRPLRIEVNELEETVTVSAGVIVKDLLEYLANFVTPLSPSGWTLGSFPWYVYQTIGGAVATGTHGSSLKHNSLSHQVTEFHVVLANGTSSVINEECCPFLMKAFRVSVGRLGVITSLTLRIIPEVPVQRTHEWMWPSQFLNYMFDIQNHYSEKNAMPAWADETQFFWSAQSQEVSKVSFTRADTGEPQQRHDILSDLIPDESTQQIIRAIASHIAASQDMNGRPGPESHSNGAILQTASVNLVHHAEGAGSNLESYQNASQIAAETAKAEAAQNIIAENGRTPSDSHSSVDIDIKKVQDALASLDTAIYKQAGRLLNLTQKINDEVAGLPENLWDMRGPTGRSWDKEPSVARQSFITTTGGSFLYSAGVVPGLESVVGNATKEATSSYIHQPLTSEVQIRGTAYSQYEIAIPASTVGDCFKGIFQLLYGRDVDNTSSLSRWEDTGFRTANLIRIVGKEDGLLSLSNDQPRIYMNLEDFIGPNMEPGEGYNLNFQEMIRFAREDESCKGTRMHWGKSGLPEPGCFRGAHEFPDTWCDFGCAVRQLDPANKFDDMSGAWNWKGVDMIRCCTSSGFDHNRDGCTCNPTPMKTGCPASPFYDIATAYNYWD